MTQLATFNDRVNVGVNVSTSFLRRHSKDALILLTGFGMPAFVLLLQHALTPQVGITAVLSLFAALVNVLLRNGQTGLARIAKFVVEVATAVGVPTLVAILTGHLDSALIAAGSVKLLGAITVYEAVDQNSIQETTAQVNDLIGVQLPGGDSVDGNSTLNGGM